MNYLFFAMIFVGTSGELLYKTYTPLELQPMCEEWKEKKLKSIVDPIILGFQHHPLGLGHVFYKVRCRRGESPWVLEIKDQAYTE